MTPRRVVMVTNIPVPYRIPVLESLVSKVDWRVDVVYCSGHEPDRHWRLQEGRYQQHYLKPRFLTYKSRYIHYNPDLWGVLRRLKPDVVITTGFNPSHLLAFAYARLHGAAHVAMTDGTDQSESRLSWAHTLVRRVVYAATQAFVGASDGSMALYRSYGIPAQRCFKSHLCADNARFMAAAGEPKRYDLLLSGRLVALKSPFFALDVAARTADKLGRRVTMAVLGSGELEADVRAHAARLADRVTVDFLGFVQQDALPARYGAARVLLFPTVWETWGVVANEAMAAGVPVIVSPAAGVAGELVRDGDTGHVLPLDLERWADACVRLLTQPAVWQAMSRRCQEVVLDYSYEHAADGLREAVVSVLEGRR